LAAAVEQVEARTDLAFADLLRLDVEPIAQHARNDLLGPHP
jgi:hypothetical protein